MRLVLFGSLFVISAGLMASEHPNIARGFDIGRPYQMNGIDNVNLFNGSLTLTIPIGQRYHVNGGMGYGLTLVYSGNVWDTFQDDGNNFVTYPNRRSNAGIGWLLSLGRLFAKNQFPTQESFDWSYESPDGAIHGFQCSGLSPGCVDTTPYFYTIDGSYLRLVISGAVRTVEFPDGTSQVFKEMNTNVSPWAPQSSTGVWRLTQINDRFGNAVNISYDSSADYKEIWTINDGSRSQAVYFVAAVGTWYALKLDHVVLSTFGAPSEASRTWTMTYETRFMGSGNPPGRGSTFHTYTVPLLGSVVLPPVGGVTQTYSMRRPDGSAYYDVSPDSNMSNGALRGLQLPTKGWIEWDYDIHVFFGDVSISRSLAVTQRRTLVPDRTPTETKVWTYNRVESTKRICINPVDNSGFTFPAEQLVVSVTSPELVTSVHYFSIYQEPGTAPCSAGAIIFDPGEYALPFTRGVADNPNGEQRYLSQETYTGTPSLATAPGSFRVTGTRRRSEWALYRFDMTPLDAAHAPESGHTTEYEDDANCGSGAGTHTDICYTSITRFGPDGAGHYRQSSTSSNFLSPADPNHPLLHGNFATTFTNYPNAVPTGIWLLNRYTEQCKVEESAFRGTMSTQSCSGLVSGPPSGTNFSGPVIKQYCFDNSGFLTKQRSLAGTVAGQHDLLSVFTQTNGNVTREDYYGGDAQTLDLADACSTTPPVTSEYQIQHTYSYGSLATSSHRAKSGDPTILEADNVIDQSTGLVSLSRDVSGQPTNYVYDALGRVTNVIPPSSEVETSYAYSESAAPFTVTGQRASASGTIQESAQFDGFGRVSREQETLPATTTSRTTTYTGSGWIDRVSQWESTPANYTSYTYDAFGRPLTITAPDTSVTTLQYLGVRSTTRAVKMGTIRSGTVISPSNTTTTETYDAQGRLANVNDGTGNDTGYSYDVSGHLTDVAMGVQARHFGYDGRGLLSTEQHPELNGSAGTVHYGGFDSRGHPATKLLSDSPTGFDVAYKYDALERLTEIDQITARSPQTTRVLKTFTFGTANGGSKGKLTQDLRHNYRGTDDVTVTEDYTYRATDGKLTDRLTTIDKAGTRLQQFTQSYDYNDIGALSFLKYPLCTDSTRPCGASTLTSVSPGFTNGMVTSLPGFANSISYHDDGTVNQIAHPGTITDTYEADDHAMGRPKSITFASYDTCARPSVASVIASPTGTLTPGTIVHLTATPGAGSGAVTYQWYRVVSAIPIAINGATSAVFSEAVSATTTYRVRVANSCGASDSASDITVTVCSPLRRSIEQCVASLTEHGYDADRRSLRLRHIVLSVVPDLRRHEYSGRHELGELRDGPTHSHHEFLRQSNGLPGIHL